MSLFSGTFLEIIWLWRVQFALNILRFKFHTLTNCNQQMFGVNVLKRNGNGMFAWFIFDSKITSSDLLVNGLNFIKATVPFDFSHRVFQNAIPSAGISSNLKFVTSIWFFSHSFISSGVWSSVGWNYVDWIVQKSKIHHFPQLVGGVIRGGNA